jgi:hypothetical protein
MNGPLNVKYDGYPVQSTYIGIVFVCSKVSKRSALTQTFSVCQHCNSDIYKFDSNIQYIATVLLLIVTIANTKVNQHLFLINIRNYTRSV